MVTTKLVVMIKMIFKRIQYSVIYLSHLIVQHLLKVRDMPHLVRGVPRKPAHDVVVDAAPVHHVQRAQVHLQAALLPVRGLLVPGLQPEHGEQLARLRELRRAAVPAELRVVAAGELDVQLAEHLGARELRAGPQ